MSPWLSVAADQHPYVSIRMATQAWGQRPSVLRFQHAVRLGGNHVPAPGRWADSLVQRRRRTPRAVARSDRHARRSADRRGRCRSVRSSRLRSPTRLAGLRNWRSTTSDLPRGSTVPGDRPRSLCRCVIWAATWPKTWSPRSRCPRAFAPSVRRSRRSTNSRIGSPRQSPGKSRRRGRNVPWRR